MHCSVTAVLKCILIFSMIYCANFMPLTTEGVCRSCMTPEECDESPPTVCIWGEARDSCNRRVCAKGPGERCGGSLNILGVCGEGMMCKSDERCYGCSIQTLECNN